MTENTGISAEHVWPALPQSAWSETCVTLQLWMQVVGKIRLALMPPINHSWQVTLYPTVRGVSTAPMPYGNRMIQIDFDFHDHLLVLEASNGERKAFPLQAMTVAAFYQRVMNELAAIGAPVQIWPTPVEVPNPIPFSLDTQHAEYDPLYARQFSRVLLQTARIFATFRSRFRGKVSPIHLFWGAMDLACTRFSGRTAPMHSSMPGLPDRVTRDAYSHEVCSCGFWPGMPGIEPMFYSYAYPEPPGYKEYPIAPSAGSYDSKLGEFVLPYETMRQSGDPDATLLSFLQSTYEAAANCAKWDRAALEVDFAVE